MNPYLQAIFPFLSGGAFGAIITQVCNHWNKRQQPISYHVSVDPIFSSGPHADSLQATAEVTYHGESFKYKDLSLVRIDLKNKSNLNMERFLCGLTLTGGHTAILVICKGRDRYHKITQQEEAITPRAPTTKVDLECAPFNRGDEYSVRLFVQNNGPLLVDHVTLATTAPVSFVGTDVNDKRDKVPAAIVGLIGCAIVIFVGLAAIYDTTPTLPGLRAKQAALETELGQQKTELMDVQAHLKKIEQEIKDPTSQPADKSE